MARCDDADRTGERGQCAFALRAEPTIRLEFGFEFRELLVQHADAGETHAVDGELKVAARFVNRGRRAYFDRQPFLERDILQLRLAAEQHAADLGAIILQGEIAMAGCGAGEARDLAADPRQPEIALDD